MSLLELVEQAVPGPLTDAVEHARAGRGASALVAAENRMLALLDGLDDDEPFTIDVAWALSQHAEVLHRFGDPDLAVAAADLALRTFLNRGDEINRMLVAKASYVRAFIAAALIAADIHERFGRADIAESARSMAADAVAGSPGITIDPALPLLADMSLARALDRVRTPVAGRSREAGEAVGRIKGSVIAPATDCSLILTSGRCSELNPVLVAQLLAVGTEAVIADDPVAGLRLGLEAHVLYASLSEAQTSEMRYDFAAHGPHWARTLLLCSRAAAQHDLRDLALDLAAWMGGAAEGLAPFVVIDTETRSLARDCLAWHAEILESSGEIDGANRAAQALRALDEMP
jgi:hypothetical protein